MLPLPFLFSKPFHISDRSDLPEWPGLYVLVAGRSILEKPLYIGKAGNIRRRWASHHKRDQASRHGVFIRCRRHYAWELPIVEAIAVRSCSPPWNERIPRVKNYRVEWVFYQLIRSVEIAIAVALLGVLVHAA